MVCQPVFSLNIDSSEEEQVLCNKPMYVIKIGSTEGLASIHRYPSYLFSCPLVAFQNTRYGRPTDQSPSIVPKPVHHLVLLAPTFSHQIFKQCCFVGL